MSNSNELKKTGMALFALGGVSSLGMLVGLKAVALPAAVLLTAAGGAVLIADAIANPESVKIPEVKVPEVIIPEIKIPTVHVNY